MSVYAHQVNLSGAVEELGQTDSRSLSINWKSKEIGQDETQKNRVQKKERKWKQ